MYLIVTPMMNEGDVLRIKRDVCVVYVLRRQGDFVMSDTVKFLDNWLATVLADNVTVLIEAFGLYFAKKILPGF